MKITFLCTDPEHPVNSYLVRWIDQIGDTHSIDLVHSKLQLTGGDFLFLVSCSVIIKSKYRKMYLHTLVFHASNVPLGRGWSPHVWDIVNGAETITLSLLEAEDRVDSGRLWLQRFIPIDRTDLWCEVNEKLFDAEVEMINEAVDMYNQMQPYPQSDEDVSTYYPKRTLADSEIDPEKSIAEQFNLIRMCDPQRYPAWFEYLGQKYKVILEKVADE